MLELLQIFRDDENRCECYMWKFSVHQHKKKLLLYMQQLSRPKRFLKCVVA